MFRSSVSRCGCGCSYDGWLGALELDFVLSAAIRGRESARATEKAQSVRWCIVAGNSNRKEMNFEDYQKWRHSQGSCVHQGPKCRYCGMVAKRGRCPILSPSVGENMGWKAVRR